MHLSYNEYLLGTVTKPLFSFLWFRQEKNCSTILFCKGTKRQEKKMWNIHYSSMMKCCFLLFSIYRPKYIKKHCAFIHISIQFEEIAQNISSNLFRNINLILYFCCGEFHIEHYKSLCLVVSSIQNDHYYVIYCEYTEKKIGLLLNVKGFPFFHQTFLGSPE